MAFTGVTAMRFSAHPAPSTAARVSNAARIDIADPQQLLDWAERLDVPPDLISDAVVQVGDDAEAVELVLKGTVQVAGSGRHH
jgi:hypothetical protein